MIIQCWYNMLLNRVALLPHLSLLGLTIYFIHSFINQMNKYKLGLLKDVNKRWVTKAALIQQC
jgi:hypothetical protein